MGGHGWSGQDSVSTGGRRPGVIREARIGRWNAGAIQAIGLWRALARIRGSRPRRWELARRFAAGSGRGPQACTPAWIARNGPEEAGGTP